MEKQYEDICTFQFWSIITKQFTHHNMSQTKKK